MARIAVGGFQHETNSFVPTRTDYAWFASHRDRPPLVRGEEVLKWMSNTSVALSGFIEASESRHQLVPLIWASGGAGGLVTREAFERISGELIGSLSRELPVDAVYLDLHGAMVSEDYEDSEGELLRRVRAAVGANVPIIVSLDYHGNVTPQMVELSDGMVAYLTYPHIDRKETGKRAADAMFHVLRKGRPNGRALRKIPFLIALNFQCTMIEPSRGIVQASQAASSSEGINVCYVAGFPPSDLFYCGPSVVAFAPSQQLADEAADALAQIITQREAQFAQPLLGPDEAVQRAIAIASQSRRPVLIADTQDNPGSGGTGDTTGMLEALIRNSAEGAVLGILCDPDAAAAAHAAGLGAQVAIDLGGKSGPKGVGPCSGRFVVCQLGDGRMRTTGPAVGGRDIDLGPMALLRIGQVRVVVSSKRVQAYDQAPFRHLGIDPAGEKILVLKSSVHFRADFQPIAEDVLIAVAPGAAIVDTTQYQYRRLRPGVRLHPLGPEFRPQSVK